jgi:N-methylhydantoinase A
MARAVRAVSIERGRDPRRFALFAFGGSGPVHAAHLALDMGIGKVVVPPAPGLFSSVGLLLSNLEHHYVQNFWRRIDGTEAAELQNIVSGMSAKAYDDLASEGYPRDRVRLQVLSDMRYVGQNSELTIPLPEAFLGSGDWAALREAFEQEHQATYGYRSTREPIQFINLRIVAEGLRGESAGIGRGGARPNGERPSQPQSNQRQVYFGPEMGWLSAPVIDRPDLDSHFQEGPLIIEEYDSTTVAPPHCRARLDEWGNINLELGRTP